MIQGSWEFGDAMKLKVVINFLGEEFSLSILHQFLLIWVCVARWTKFSSAISDWQWHRPVCFDLHWANLFRNGEIYK